MSLLAFFVSVVLVPLPHLVDDEDDDAYYHGAEADDCERDQEPLLNLVPLLVIAATPSATTTT